MPAALATSSTQRSARAGLVRGLQIVVTLAAVAYLYSHIKPSDRAALVAAFSQISVRAFALAIGVIYVSYGLAVLRWRLLLAAFDAVAPPSLGRLTKYYLVGAFYNTYLPGAVGGELVRGLASRDAFGPSGAASALAVVFVERIIGLAGLLLLTAAATFVHPLPGIVAPWLLASAGIGAALAALVALLVARRLSEIVPARLAAWLVRLPVPAHVGPLLATVPLSIGCQVLPAFSGHLLLAALVPQAHFVDSLVIFPLALAAAYIPITMSGAGVREAIFVHLAALVGIPGGLALAASLSLWLSQALVAASGGLWVLLRPLGVAPPPD